MKIASDTLLKILDLLCASPVIRHVSAAAGISEATYFAWWMRSRKNDPLFEVEWMGVRQQWAEHLKVAREVYLTHLEAGFIERMERGTDEPVFWQGRPSWQTDPQFEKWTDEEMTALGYPLEARYLHDEKTGKRLMHTIHHPPPVQGALATLAAHSPKWRTKTDLSVTGKVALGVSVISRAAKAIDVTPKPPQIEHRPDLPLTEISSEASQRTTGLPIEDNFSAGAEIAVEAPVDRTPAYTPPEGSSKIPLGPVKIFSAEAADDPPESVGDKPDTPAEPPPAVKAPRPDVMQHVNVRAAMRKLHDGERGSNAVEMQIMNALTLKLMPEQRERRLRELVGDFRDQDDRSEGLGAGIASGPKGVRMA
jgi:hypothetical protein